jgi:hypothetical protein
VKTRQDVENLAAAYLNRSDLTVYVSRWFEIAYEDIQRKRDFAIQECTMSTQFVFDPVTGDGIDQYDIPSDWKTPLQVYSFDPTASAVIEIYHPLNKPTIIDRRMGLFQAPPQAFGWWAAPTEEPCYGIWAGKFEIFPKPGSTLAGKDFRLDYYRYLPAPASGTSTWFTEHAFDYLLYRTLQESAPFLGDDPRLAQWLGLQQTAYASILASDVMTQESGELVMRG